MRASSQRHATHAGGVYLPAAGLAAGLAVDPEGAVVVAGLDGAGIDAEPSGTLPAVTADDEAALPGTGINGGTPLTRMGAPP